MKGTLASLFLAALFDLPLRKRRRRRRNMLLLMKLSGFFSFAMAIIVLSPSLHSFPPAEAIRQISSVHLSFRQSPPFVNSPNCTSIDDPSSPCNPSFVHVAITLDRPYLRGSIAAVHSILQHSLCPNNIFFHFLVSDPTADLETLILSAFPNLHFKTYFFDPNRVLSLISSSVRSALEQPLNYARNYLAHIVDPCVRRIIYLDSDVIVVDDVIKLWITDLGLRTIGAPEYCHANFTKYFTERFWGDHRL